MARFKYLTKADLAPENRDLLARDIALDRILAHSPAAPRPALPGAGPLYPLRQQSRRPPARTRDPAGRLPDALALRIFAPYQDRLRVRRLGGRYSRDDRRDRGTSDKAGVAGEARAAGGARDDAGPRNLRRDVQGAARASGRGAAARSHHHHRLLQCRGARPGDDAGRCRAGLPGVPRTVPPARFLSPERNIMRLANKIAIVVGAWTRARRRHG